MTPPTLTNVQNLTGFYCPITSQRSPHFAEVEQNAMAWAKSFGLIHTDKMRSSVNRLQIPDFAARAYPEARPQALQVIVDWAVWAFFADDQHDALVHHPDRLAAAYRGHVEVLRGATSPDGNVMGSALADIRNRILLYASDQCLKRFTSTVERWFQSMYQECTNRHTGYAPDLSRYAALRSVSVGMHTMYALYDVSHYTRLSEELWCHPALQKLMAISSNIIAWANDVFSFPKERAAGDPHNMILILERDFGCSTEQAVDETLRRHNAEMQRFLDCSEEFAVNEPVVYQRVDPFIAMIRSWIRGHLDWAFYTTQRYDLVKSEHFQLHILGDSSNTQSHEQRVLNQAFLEKHQYENPGR